ncbi:hypothetical protein BZG74_09165 [Salinivibrio sharmensis]|uniref:EamA domain-containing protein n=2 Tax=Salinivibrio sharmensis TaxID=390883 RepID=A0ABX3KH71_9GAMM|nr:hypothetical protein BZG74_09165 [Salinivibrio sharmensis]
MLSALVVVAVMVINVDIGRRILHQSMDPASYIGLWLLAASLVAIGVLRLCPHKAPSVQKDKPLPPLLTTGQLSSFVTWRLAGLLFLAITSAVFACRLLDIATLGLVVVAGVQGVLGVVSRSHHQHWLWAGLMMVFAGLGYLLAPGMYAPHPLGVGLGLISGGAWASYWSQVVKYPNQAELQVVASLRISLLLVLPLLVFTLPNVSVSVRGGGLAVLAGALFVVGVRLFGRFQKAEPQLLSQQLMWVTVLLALMGLATWDQSSMMNMRLTSAAVVVMSGLVVIGIAGRADPDSPPR